MSNILKKWWFYVGISIILIIIIGTIYLLNNRKTIYSEYKKQAISILEDYKKNKTDRQTTVEKINNLKTQLSREIDDDKINKSDVLLSAFDLRSALSIDFDIQYNYDTISIIDNTIKSINKLDL